MKTIKEYFSTNNSFDFLYDLILYNLNCTVSDCKCEVIVVSNIFENLGLIIEKNLNWQNHI